MTGAGGRSGHRFRARRGFTLIELMVALLVSSLLVGMILAIFSRMSLAYRGQQQIAGVQQVLAAARATVEIDAKQAGLGMPNGFTVAMTGATLRSPVMVANASAAPDQIAFFYADTSTQAVVTTIPALPVLQVDASTGFAPGDLIVLAKPDTSTASPFANEANLTTYSACVVQIAAGGGSVSAGPPATITIAGAGSVPWGGTGHCAAGPSVGTMVYKFVAHAYRIDTTLARVGLGALQQGSTGGLLGANEVWNDLAYGFSDLQTALRAYQPIAGADPDGDLDTNRDWYSGDTQNALTTLPTAAPAPANAVLLQMSISLVAHTDRDVEGISSTQVPAMIDATKPLTNNTVGDHAAVVLPLPPPPWPNALYPGLRIYRYTTFQVDLRNLGVGR
jgi:prepilin-type N-terminal cleavage/methylation domain-containing protein